MEPSARGFLLILATVMVFGLITWSCAQGDETETKPVIRLHDVQGESQWINNAIAKFIIEKGYGYPVEAVVGDTASMELNLPSGVIDLNLEGWQQNIIAWHDDQLAAGTIVNLAGGKTADDLRVFIQQDPKEPLPDWAVPSGGPADTSPGVTAVVTQNLQEGSYVWVTYILGDDEIALDRAWT